MQMVFETHRARFQTVRVFGEDDVVLQPAMTCIDAVKAADVSPTHGMLAAGAPKKDVDPVERPVYPEMSQAAITAVHDCLNLLADSKDDLGPDGTFIRSPRRRDMPTSSQAWLCRRLVDRHRDLLPAELAAVAMGELATLPSTMPTRDPATASHIIAVSKRGNKPGAPPKNRTAMTAAERQRAWRAAHKTVAFEVKASTAARLKALREASGLTTEELLNLMLSALEREADDPQQMAKPVAQLPSIKNITG